MSILSKETKIIQFSSCSRARWGKSQVANYKNSTIYQHTWRKESKQDSRELIIIIIIILSAMCFLWSGLDDETCTSFDVYWTVHHCDNWRIKNKLVATYYFIVRLIGSTCFGQYYTHHQELATIMLFTTLVFLSWLVVGWRLGAVRLEYRPGCRLQLE